MTEQISNTEWILLSSYLDGELNPTEKAQVEFLLRTRPEMQQAYQSLVDTKATLRRAAPHQAPRNFTLTPQMIPQPRRNFWLVPVLRFSSVAAALVAVILFFNPFTVLPQAVPMAAVTLENAAQETPAAALSADTAATQPPVIYWGGPPPQAKTDGAGGASVGTLCPEGPCQYSAGGGYGGGGDLPAPNVNAATPEDLLRSFAEAPPAPDETPVAAPDVSLPAATPAGDSSLTGSGPILGVQTEGSASMDTAAPKEFTQSLPMVTADNASAAGQSASTTARIWVAAGLLVLALAGLITSFVLAKGRS